MGNFWQMVWGWISQHPKTVIITIPTAAFGAVMGWLNISKALRERRKFKQEDDKANRMARVSEKLNVPEYSNITGIRYSDIANEIGEREEDVREFFDARVRRRNELYPNLGKRPN